MSDRHRALFNEYVRDLRQAKEAAEQWWCELIAAENPADEDAGLKVVKKRWPDGPASHPMVVGVIIRYLAACDALNRELGEEDEVYLNRFSMDWLDSKKSSDVSDFLDLSYWPMGLDEMDELV